jgi:MscS family membrane protein
MGADIVAVGKVTTDLPVDLDTLLESLRPLLDYFSDKAYARAGITLLLGLLAAYLAGLVSTRVLRRLAQKTRSPLDDQIIAILHRPLFWSVALLGALLALRLLQPAETLMQPARALVATLLILIWAVFALRLLRVVLRSMAARAKSASLVRPQTLPLFNNLAVIVVLALAIYFVFNAWHIDMTAWLASAGIVGIAVGFAAKDTLANLFSGVFILADAPYKIGDYVVLESGERGKITHIGIRSTRLLTRDDVEVTIPNAIMGNTRIVNESGGPHEKFRIRVQVGVAYGSDIDQVRRVLTEVAEAEPDICADPEPRVRFRSFGNSALEFELLGWVDNPELRGRVIDALNGAVYKRFQAEHITIPFPQQDLYIKELPRQP